LALAGAMEWLALVVLSARMRTEVGRSRSLNAG
jgi:hypothetical protein